MVCANSVLAFQVLVRDRFLILAEFPHKALFGSLGGAFGVRRNVWVNLRQGRTGVCGRGVVVRPVFKVSREKAVHRADGGDGNGCKRKREGGRERMLRKRNVCRRGKEKEEEEGNNAPRVP